ncbi:MAG: ATP-dependent DNA ligase, partial [Undibacterium sp.]|nr:ATP-dependent DNA ligase [Opitutaceae bacterium]
MPWDVQFLTGSLYLPQLDWWLDAHHPAPRSFVSHAHFDHLAPHREILCSTGTARVMRARMPGERIEHILPFEQTEQLTADTTIALHPAGHIYGSAQSLLTHADHGKLLYTGDFKLRPGLSAERCATPRADVLIMETTYGLPHYVLPPTADVLAAIVAFCREALADGETPVLFGYSLGKSQEILSSLAGARLPAMLHPQTLRLTRVYEELGLTFPPYREFSADEVAGHVVICPPQSRTSAFLKKIPTRRTAAITGWALDPGAIHRYQCDAAFPLSDHADYADLLRFVELVQPTRVLTLHGFAREFAATLRERGLDAWALTHPNQLELSLPKLGRVIPNAPSPPPAPSGPPIVPIENFQAFALLANQLKDTPARLEKTELLRAYFSTFRGSAGTSAPGDPTPAPAANPAAASAALAALYFTARPFPQSSALTLNLGWALIKRALHALSGLNEADYRAVYQRFPDAGDGAEAALQNRTTPAPFSLLATAEFLTALANTRAPTDKLDLLQSRLGTLTPVEAKFLIKLLLGDLRIGLKDSLVEDALAAATGQPLELIREAHMLCGDLAAVTRAAFAGTLESIQLRVFQPIQFMLASPEPTADAILARLTPPVWLEEKYDGIRCQLHKSGDRVELYSRDLHRITSQFPDLARAALALTGDCVLDGELLAWKDGRALPFAELQKRLGRTGGDDFFLGAEIPVAFSAYDLLWLNGDSLLKAALSTRRAALENLLNRESRIENRKFHLAPTTAAHTALDIEAAFLAARARGHEGLMAKDPTSLYTPGRRGLAWLKLKKAYATLDVVVVAVEFGHGKRRDVLSDYTFAIRDENQGDRLLTVGKAYSGLTDAEIAALTAHFLETTTEIKGRLRHVVPDTVPEIAFDSIQPSARHQSGFALRFPRIARIRT